MTPDVQSPAIPSLADAQTDCERSLALMRQRGADGLSPMDFQYMAALARRMRTQAPNVQRILEAKLALAIAAYQARFDQAQSDTVLATRRTACVRDAGHTPLSQLVQSLAQHTSQPEASSWAASTSLRTELKSVRHFRNTWSTLSARKQLSQALGQAPKNAGPINSHMLVLRSLALMRDISPDYLNRFMSYADTLLCLDQSDLSAKAAKVKPLASAKPAPRMSAGPAGT